MAVSIPGPRLLGPTGDCHNELEAFSCPPLLMETYYCERESQNLAPALRTGASQKGSVHQILRHAQHIWHLMLSDMVAAVRVHSGQLAGRHHRALCWRGHQRACLGPRLCICFQTGMYNCMLI